jgi:YidC/Oxa1 family membrane protein insertase
MVSTHMIYRPRAFDHYDSVLCVGPHHVQEIRATEEHSGLAAKRLIEHGYGRLDALLEHRAVEPARLAPTRGQRRKVLVAPSWGSEGLLEARGVELVESLLGAGYDVTVRPHPVTRQKWPDSIGALEANFGEREGFRLEEDIGSQESLHEADVMISDWSGAALEYAFAFERPVVFVDVPRKVNNPSYAELALEPLEVSAREEIGVVVSPERLAELPRHIERLCDDPDAFAARIRDARSRAVYHVGSSGRVGAAYVAGLADEWLRRI